MKGLLFAIFLMQFLAAHAVGQDAANVLRQLHDRYDTALLVGYHAQMQYFNDTATTVPSETLSLHVVRRGRETYYKIGDAVEGLNRDGLVVQVFHEDREIYAMSESASTPAGADVLLNLDTILKVSGILLSLQQSSDGRDCVVITTKDPNQPETKLYFDDSNGIRIKRIVTKYRPEAVWNETPSMARVEIVFNDEAISNSQFPSDRYRVADYVIGYGAQAKPAERYQGYTVKWIETLDLSQLEKAIKP